MLQLKKNKNSPSGSWCFMDKYFGLSSPAIISFWVIRRSGDAVCIGTKATRGASIGEVSSEHGDSHSITKK